MRYPTPPGDGLAPVVDEFRKTRREQREQARPAGTNINKLVDRVRNLITQVQALYQQVQDALVNITATVQNETTAFLSAGTVTMNSINATGRVTSADPIRSPGARTYVVSTGYAGLWAETDGTFGISPSSRRFKTDFEEWTPDIARLLELHAVLFRYNLPGSDPNAPKQLGFIAEDLAELGFTEFLFYDAEGLVEGINYDRLTVALLVLAQAQEARLRAVEDRLGL